MFFSGATVLKEARGIAAALGCVFAALSAAQAQVSPPPVEADRASPPAAGEREAGTEAAERSFSDGFELRTFEQDTAGDMNLRVSEPLTPAGRDASQRFQRDLGDPAAPDEAEPIFPEEDSPPAAPPPDFDLFEGPSSVRASRENLPGGLIDGGRAEPVDSRAAAVDPPETGVLAAGRAETVGAAAGLRGAAIAQPDLFAPAGPVRSPAFRELVAGGRLDSGLTGLRQSFPIDADDPFAPVGIRAGRFVLYPVLEQSVGASDNLLGEPDGEGGVFSQTAVSARLLSDWARHEAEINAAALYRRNFEGSPEDEPRLDLDARLRLDLGRDLAATLRGAFSYSREDPILSGDPLVGAEVRPDLFAYSLGAELRREVGRSNVSVTGDVVREDKDAAGSSAFASVPDESFTTYTAGLRAGYDIAPLLKPFLAGSVGRRAFDDEEDVCGCDRGSLIPSLRAGLAFDMSEKLYGEIAFGYAWNIPEEDGFGTTRSPTVDARLNWSPRRGTDVVLAAETFFDPGDGAGAASTLYQGSLALRHRATARVDVNGRLVAAYRDDERAAERTYAAEGGLTYWLNRGLALTGLVRHERLDGDAPGSDYDANSVRIGLRMQR